MIQNEYSILKTDTEIYDKKIESLFELQTDFPEWLFDTLKTDQLARRNRLKKFIKYLSNCYTDNDIWGRVVIASKKVAPILENMIKTIDEDTELQTDTSAQMLKHFLDKQWYQVRRCAYVFETNVQNNENLIGLLNFYNQIATAVDFCFEYSNLGNEKKWFNANDSNAVCCLKYVFDLMIDDIRRLDDMLEFFGTLCNTFDLPIITKSLGGFNLH
jgi:hypothetical protein